MACQICNIRLGCFLHQSILNFPDVVVIEKVFRGPITKRVSPKHNCKVVKAEDNLVSAQPRLKILQQSRLM